jgi:adenosyl cobinamide kinase/adenosyl cobinamide phosphate guanylyltransferase
MALTLITGAVRSGKSRLAVRLASEAERPVVFMATATAGDAEMAQRIERHRSERPADWNTIEERIELDKRLTDSPDDACVLVDCLNLWVSNLIGDGYSDDEIEARARLAAAIAGDRDGLTIAVTNEVGWSIHPQSELGRRFIDVLGRVNSVWSELATQAYLVVAGRVLVLGAPVVMGIEDV